MPKNCKHIRHEVEPQHNVWNGGVFKRVQPAQVYCADCKQWIYEKPINWDLVPKNATARREARIDDSCSSRRTAPAAGEPGSQRRVDAG